MAGQTASCGTRGIAPFNCAIREGTPRMTLGFALGMSLPQAIALFVAAVLGGALNAVAGGGSVITLPTLILAGVPPVQASATNTTALWPGSLASATAYRDALDVSRATLSVLGAASVVGGLLGAVVLLHTPQRTFLRLTPSLLLAATLLFAFGGRLTSWVRARWRKGSTPPWLATAGLALLQLVIATYGGFFGGGMSILILAMLALTGMEDIHTMNALKIVLASIINGVAVVAFVLLRAVFWPQALVMVVGAIAGGYGGAKLARRVNPTLIRRFVIVVGVAMTVYFFFFVRA